MHITTRRAGEALLLICAASALSAGCGGSMAPAMNEPTTTTAAGSAAPANVPDALSQLDQAEAELGRALGQPTYAQPAQPSEAQQAPSAASPPEPARPGDTTWERKVEAPSTPADPCATACQALASMSRSATHVCALAGESDDRCSSARSRVSRATDRVRAQCPACQ